MSNIIEIPQIALDTPVGKNQATISWTVQPGLFYNIFAKGYWNNQAHEQYVEISNVTESSFTFDQCIPNNTIKTYIKASDGINTSLASNLLTFATAPTMPVIEVTHQNTFLVNESLVSDIYFKILSDGATLCSLYCNGALIAGLEKNTEGYFVYTHRVLPGNTYTYKAESSSASYNLSASEEFVISLPEASFLKDIFISQITDRSFVVEWGDASLASPYINYDINVQTISGAYNKSYSSDELALAVSGLGTNTSYNVSVIASYEDTAHGFLHNLGYPVIAARTLISPPTVLQITTATTAAKLTCNEVFGAEHYNFYLEGQLVKRVDVPEFNYTGLIPGTYYSFACTALKGEYETRAEAIQARSLIEAPVAIQFNNVTYSTVGLSWESVSGATAYNIYILKNGYELVGNTIETNFLHESLQPYTNYSYSISALFNTIESSKSEIFDIKTKVPPPAAPQNLTALNLGNGRVSLTWDTVYGYDQELDYNVYIDDIHTYTVQEPNGIAANLQKNKLYSFYVTAQNASGESEPFKKMEVITTPDLKTPTGVGMEITGNVLEVNWGIVSEATGYVIYLNGQEFLCDLPPFIYENPVPGMDYSAMVQAVNNDGSSYKSTPIVKQASMTTETMSDTITFVTGSYGFTVNWSEHPQAYSYKIIIGTEAINTPSNFAIITGKDPDTDYNVSVVALTPTGETDPISAIAHTRIPPPDTLNIYSNTAAQLTFSWIPVEGAASYRIVNVTGDLIVAETETVVATSAASSAVANNYDYTAANEYYFAIYSVGTTGLLSDRSELFSFTGLDVAVGAPSGLSASMIETNSLQISWDKIETATAYNVYVDEALVTTILAPICFANLNGMTAGTSYQIQVSSLIDDNEYALSSAFTVITKPDKPASVSITQIDKSVKLAWSAVTSATAYRLYYKTNYSETSYSGVGLSVGLPGYNQSSPALLSAAYYFADSTEGLAVYLYDFNLNTPYWFGISAVNAQGVESKIAKYSNNFTWTDPSMTSITSLEQRPLVSYGVNQTTGAIVLKWYASTE